MLIIISILSRTQIRIKNKPIIIHFTILLVIVFLFYMKYEKSAFMASLLYLIMYSLTDSYKIKEYFASSDNLPNHSLKYTENPTDKKADSILSNNNLPSQITSWFTGDSFDASAKDVIWRDLASNNHLYLTSPAIKLNNSLNNASGGPRKWVSGDITTQLSIPLSASVSASTSAPTDSVTFVHLTRYSPRTTNRGKLWSNETGTWISGYNDNKIIATNMDGSELPNRGGDKNGDIMNIRGSNWNVFIDQMDMTKKERTVNVNGNDYVFQNPMQAIPQKIGLNVNSGDKSDWESAEIMVYPRILDASEIAQITAYFNKKYSLKSTDKIAASTYNMYNHYTFSSIPESDWISPPQVGSTTQSGNKLLGITDSEYECVSLCDTNMTSCGAFSYHMEKGTCYSVDEKNILNHTTPNKATLSGTNRVREDIAQKAKEEAERKAREEAERQRLAAIEAERQRLAAIEAARLAAIEAERQRLAAIEAERQRQIEAAAEESRRQWAAHMAQLQQQEQQRQQQEQQEQQRQQQEQQRQQQEAAAAAYAYANRCNRGDGGRPAGRCSSGCESWRYWDWWWGHGWWCT